MNPSSEAVARAYALARARLSAPSLAHCERVAVTARALAQRFGVDEEKAELAGLLHDYCRDETDEALLAQAASLSMPLLQFEREHPYLLHARVAAALLRTELPGLGEAVLSAIAVHTVGAVPMSDLDRIVYLADMIEPSRDFPGVEGIRWSCASDDLAECFRRGYARSLAYLMETGRPLHPVSAAVSFSIERETGRPLFDLEAVE
ncbi:MAG: bis(5'-nucleosyl)-tetraphosphatase (symmetrical) YqeK [Coriobacteriia bacterium]|nr:bis(5'-nucleosyl)-tetraphosphatase (symmetrical) YqeK [Coriobacteriia bacterium]